MVAVRGGWVVRIDPAIFYRYLILLRKRSSFFQTLHTSIKWISKDAKGCAPTWVGRTRLRTKPFWQGCKLWTIKLGTYDAPLRAAMTLHTGPYLFAMLKRHCASFVFDVPKLQCAWSFRPVSKRTSRWIACSPGPAVFENLSKEPSDDPLMALWLAQCSLAERKSAPFLKRERWVNSRVKQAWVENKCFPIGVCLWRASLPWRYLCDPWMWPHKPESIEATWG